MFARPNIVGALTSGGPVKSALDSYLAMQQNRRASRRESSLEQLYAAQKGSMEASTKERAALMPSKIKQEEARAQDLQFQTRKAGAQYVDNTLGNMLIMGITAIARMVIAAITSINVKPSSLLLITVYSLSR